MATLNIIELSQNTGCALQLPTHKELCMGSDPHRHLALGMPVDLTDIQDELSGWNRQLNFRRSNTTNTYSLATASPTSTASAVTTASPTATASATTTACVTAAVSDTATASASRIKSAGKVAPRCVCVHPDSLRERGYRSFKEWDANPDHVYIGRDMSHAFPGAVESKWGNPFPLSDYERETSLEFYEKDLRVNSELMNSIGELEGKEIGCWCKPEACHGDILIRIFNETYN